MVHCYGDSSMYCWFFGSSPSSRLVVMDGAMDVLNILACLRSKSIAAETAKEEANASAIHFESASNQVQRKNSVLLEQTNALRKRLDIEQTFRKDTLKALDDAENLQLREKG